MKRSAKIVGRNQDEVLYGWIMANGDFRLAWPEPLRCASRAQAVLAVVKWERESRVIGKLPVEAKPSNPRLMDIL